MYPPIVSFCREAAKKWGLIATWVPESDTYLLHKNNRAVMGFTGKEFSQIPPYLRKRMIEPLLKVGLNHNLGEKTRDGLYTRVAYGKRIA